MTIHNFKKKLRSPPRCGLRRSWLNSAFKSSLWRSYHWLLGAGSCVWTTRKRDGDAHRFPPGFCSADDGSDGPLFPVRELLIAVSSLLAPSFVAVLLCVVRQRNHPALVVKRTHHQLSLAQWAARPHWVLVQLLPDIPCRRRCQRQSCVLLN